MQRVSSAFDSPAFLNPGRGALLPVPDFETLDRAEASSRFEEAEHQFAELVKQKNLDQRVESRPSLIFEFERRVQEARDIAYLGAGPLAERESAHLFLQRILYRINRLNFFWYDDLGNYENEDSSYLRQLHSRIEEGWQHWELASIDLNAL